MKIEEKETSGFRSQQNNKNVVVWIVNSKSKEEHFARNTGILFILKSEKHLFQAINILYLIHTLWLANS